MDRLANIRDWLGARRGWRRWLWAFGFGALSALALPPFHLVFLLIPVFVGVLWLVEGAGRLRSALAVGWWFGFGQFLAGLHWIANAFLVDPERFGWMAPLAVPGLSAYLALFPMAAIAVYFALPGRGIGRVLIFAVAWVGAEMLRGILLTGFPWNLMGTVWAFSDAAVQGVALFGTWGLGLITVIAAAAPAVLGERGGRAWPVVLAFAVVSAVWGGGALRLMDAEVAEVEGVRLRLIQPAIPQKLKWVPDLRVGHVRTQITMSLEPPADGGPPPTHVIWGETMVPFNAAHAPGLLDALRRTVPEGGALIFGAPRYETEADGERRVWNSLHGLDGAGRITATYDKSHLVPFGEYVPLRDVLGLQKLTAGATDFSAGPGPRTLEIPGLPPAGALICYEVIFPGQVIAAGERPGWLLNLTNDAWYGRSTGPYQHFAATRLRAVEEGLPLVRVANTGISAVIDPFGRVTESISLDRKGVVDANLPLGLESPTFFAEWGPWVMLLPSVILVLAGLVLMRRSTSENLGM